MLNKSTVERRNAETHFFYLYKVVHERERYLSDEAKIIQYSAVLRYFMKFLGQRDVSSTRVLIILYRVFIKLGDIYCKYGLQNQDNTRYFLAAEYYNQALQYAYRVEDKRHVLLALKDVYYYLGDEDALVEVEQSWAENHEEQDKFAAYVLLAQNSDKPYIKANFLAKALEMVMAQNESFYTKYQDTLHVCSQLSVLYELLGDGDNAKQIKKLREKTLKLLN